MVQFFHHSNPGPDLITNCNNKEVRMLKVKSARSGIIFSYVLYICYHGTTPSPNLASCSFHGIQSISRRSGAPSGQASWSEIQAIQDLSINTSIWDTALSRTFVSNTSSMASILLKEVKQFTLLQSIILVATFFDWVPIGSSSTILETSHFCARYPFFLLWSQCTRSQRESHIRKQWRYYPVFASPDMVPC